MSTAITTQSQAPATLNLFDPAVFETAQRLCTLYANSELVPDMYRISEVNPQSKAIANCLIAMEMSQRIGANVLMVMQNLTIVHGRPTFSSKFLIGTINSCGRFKPLEFKIRSKGKLGIIKYTEYKKTWETGSNGRRFQKTEAVIKEFDGREVDNLECIASTTLKTGSAVLESSPITIEMAIKEGWFLKAGSKWQTMPEQMLRYRAASFWTNVYAPDLSMGMRTVEDVQDTAEDVEYEDVADSQRAETIRQSEASESHIDMDVPEAPAPEAPANVDTSTGEIFPEPDENPYA